MSNKQNQKTEKELQEMDDLLDRANKIGLELKEQDLAVDFITEFALNKLSLADYDMIIDHLQHNRKLHDEVE